MLRRFKYYSSFSFHMESSIDNKKMILPPVLAVIGLWILLLLFTVLVQTESNNLSGRIMSSILVSTSSGLIFPPVFLAWFLIAFFSGFYWFKKYELNKKLTLLSSIRVISISALTLTLIFVIAASTEAHLLEAAIIGAFLALGNMVVLGVFFILVSLLGREVKKRT